jgi:hypothetical protein
METKRNCGSDSTDDETPTVPVIMPRPVLGSTSLLRPTLIPLSGVGTTCFSSCCDNYFYDRPPA